MTQLFVKHCIPCEGNTLPLAKDRINQLLRELPDWQLNETNTQIAKVFSFKNYYHTIAFVNAIAWMTHQENHHPVIEIGYNRCMVRYTTHAIKGLSENDFICASKVDNLLNN